MRIERFQPLHLEAPIEALASEFETLDEKSILVPSRLQVAQLLYQTNSFSLSKLPGYAARLLYGCCIDCRLVDFWPLAGRYKAT